MRIRALLALVFIVTVGTAAVDNSTLQKAFNDFNTAVEEIGEPNSSEVKAEVEELEDLRGDAQNRLPELIRVRDYVDNLQKKLDSRARDHEDRQRKIDFDQKVLDADIKDFLSRLEIHNAEARRQWAALSAASTPEAWAAANAWGAEVTERKKLFDAEGSLLDERKSDLEQERWKLGNDIYAWGEDLRRAQWWRRIADRDTSRFLSICTTGRTRATALKQISDVAGRPEPYESPTEMGDKLVGELFTQMGKDAFLKSLKTKVGKKVLRQMTGITLSGGSLLAISIADELIDSGLDVALAGINHRNREVEKNIFLIGEYARVMKEMIKNEGKEAVDDPEYQAMLSEIERLRSDLPSSEGEMIMQGFKNSSAIVAAFAAVASQYAGKKAEHYAGKITNHLNNMQRQTLGKGGVKFFREALKTVAEKHTKEISKELTKSSAEKAEELLDQIKEKRSQH